MVNMENYEEYLLLYADGELGEAEQKELLAFINRHPGLKAEMDMYAATKLMPDEAIVYNGKEQLMKSPAAGRSISLRSWWVYGAAAACVALLVTIGVSNHPEGNTSAPIAHTAAPEKSIGTAVYEELHSTPANPVAMKTTPPLTKPVYVADAKPKNQQHTTPIAHQPTVAKQDVHAQESVPPTPAPLPTLPEKPMNEVQRTVADATPIATPVLTPSSPTEVKEDKIGLLASLPVKQENIQGLTALSKTVSEKLEQIKDLPGKLRDTDVRFRIGKKELFVVRL